MALTAGHEFQEKTGQKSKLTLRSHPANHLIFSSASLWEISIKNGLERTDFNVDPRRLWCMLLVSGYRELPVTGKHAVAVNDLPPLHKDLLGRILVAQARVEGLLLLTADKAVAKYGDGVRKV